jgi:hypothetical protein
MSVCAAATGTTGRGPAVRAARAMTGGPGWESG